METAAHASGVCGRMVAHEKEKKTYRGGQECGSTPKKGEF